MRRKIFTLAFLIFSGISFLSCRETQREEHVVKERKIEVEVEKEENEGVLERTAKKVDKEVNKEIDEEIEKIGDDN